MTGPDAICVRAVFAPVPPCEKATGRSSIGEWEGAREGGRGGREVRGREGGRGSVGTVEAIERPE